MCHSKKSRSFRLKSPNGSGAWRKEKSLGSICELHYFDSPASGVTPVSKQPLVSEAICLTGSETPPTTPCHPISPSQPSHPPAFPPPPYFPIISATQYSTREGSHIKKIARLFKEQSHRERGQLKGSIRRPETHARLSSAVFYEGVANTLIDFANFLDLTSWSEM